MNRKSFLLTAVFLAVCSNTTRTMSLGDEYSPGRNFSRSTTSTHDSNVHPAQLAELAADLARTAAKLAAVQNFPTESSESHGGGDSRGAHQFASSRRDSAKDSTQTTIEWLGTKADNYSVSEPGAQGSASPRNDTTWNSEGTSPEATDSSRNLHTLPTAQAVPTNSQVIQVLANEEPYYTARAYQEPAEEAAPGVNDDFDYLASDSAVDWGNSDLSCGAGCSCKRCKRPPIFVVGTEVLFLNPDLNGTASSYTFNDFVAPSTARFATDMDSVSTDNLYITPRLWMGIQGERWGVVGRYFHMRVGENAHDPFVLTSGASIPSGGTTGLVSQGFNANNILDAYYVDLELTRNFCLRGCKNQFSFGARYASFENNQSVYGVSAVTEGIINGEAHSNRQAHGTGLTFGLSGRKPLFCNSCAHWFYNVRSSILWGNIDNAVETYAEAREISGGGAPANAGSIDGAFIAPDDDLFIGEIQLGVEWDFAMRCLPAKSFFRVAFEYQYWDAATGEATAGSFAGFGGGPSSQVDTFAHAPGLRMDLLGFSVGTGFTW